MAGPVLQVTLNHVVIIPNRVVPKPWKAELLVEEMVSWASNYNNADCGEPGKSGHESIPREADLFYLTIDKAS